MLPLIIGPVTIKANGSQVAVVLDGTSAISPGTPSAGSPQLLLAGQNNPNGSNPFGSTGSPGTLQESCPGVLGNNSSSSFIAFPAGNPTTYNSPTSGVYQQLLTKAAQTPTSTYFGPNVRTVYGPAFGVVDSSYVDISGFEIHDFCAAFVSLRSQYNHFHHNHIYYTSGAAGIIITGDAGNFAGSSTSGLSVGTTSEYNIIHDTGDGQECTRGTSNGTYQYNIQYERRDYVNYYPTYQTAQGIAIPGTRPGDNPYSQGIECAAGTPYNDLNIIMQGNNLSGYSDGEMHNAAQNVWDVGNIIIGTTYGITHTTAGTAGEGFIGTVGTVAGNGNNITSNRLGVGIAKTTDMTVTKNRIYNNAQNLISLPSSAGGTQSSSSPVMLGIDVNLDGVTPNNTPGVQNYPVLSSGVWNANDTFTLQGSLSQPSTPNATFTVEFYAGDDENPTGYGEGEVSLGTLAVTTDAVGYAPITFSGSGVPFGTTANFTATATSAAGQTSEFSQALALTRAAPNPISGPGCPNNYSSGNLNVSGPCVLDGANISGNVNVSGGSLTALGGTFIAGNLRSNGASLYISSTTVNGNLQVQNVPAGGSLPPIVAGAPALVAGLPGLVVCGTNVGGNIEVQAGAAPIQIGSLVEATVQILNHEAPTATQCASNSIGGNLQVQSNTGSVAIAMNQVNGNLKVNAINTGWIEALGNTVGGNIQVQDNPGSVLVMANTARGNIQCQNNGIVDTGYLSSGIVSNGNSAGGHKQGQCAR